MSTAVEGGAGRPCRARHVIATERAGRGAQGRSWGMLCHSGCRPAGRAPRRRLPPRWQPGSMPGSAHEDLTPCQPADNGKAVWVDSSARAIFLENILGKCKGKSLCILVDCFLKSFFKINFFFKLRYLTRLNLVQLPPASRRLFSNFLKSQQTSFILFLLLAHCKCKPRLRKKNRFSTHLEKQGVRHQRGGQTFISPPLLFSIY